MLHGRPPQADETKKGKKKVRKGLGALTGDKGEAAADYIKRHRKKKRQGAGLFPGKFDMQR